MNYSLLLSDEEYQNEFKKGHQTPYTYEIVRDGQSIFYFGAEHSRDTKISQWKKLEEYWNRFLKSVSGNKIVLLEGPARPLVLNLSQEEIIKQFGEVGLAMFYAKQNEIEIAWPDLSMQEEAKQLGKLFDSRLVAYFIFARSAGAWLRLNAGESFEEVINRAIQNTSRRIESVPNTNNFFSSIHKQVFLHEFTPDEKETIMRAAVPVYRDSVINEIARASSRLRNEHLVSEIERYWKGGISVFIVFGSSHAVIQEKALKSLLKS